MINNELLKNLYKQDLVINVDKNYIPDGEKYLREIIFSIFRILRIPKTWTIIS